MRTDKSVHVTTTLFLIRVNTIGAALFKRLATEQRTQRQC